MRTCVFALALASLSACAERCPELDPPSPQSVLHPALPSVRLAHATSDELYFELRNDTDREFHFRGREPWHPTAFSEVLADGEWRKDGANDSCLGSILVQSLPAGRVIQGHVPRWEPESLGRVTLTIVFPDEPGDELGNARGLTLSSGHARPLVGSGLW